MWLRGPGTVEITRKQATERDDIAVIEVMAETVDRGWWAELRRRLEHEFSQDEIVIRGQWTERL